MRLRPARAVSPVPVDRRRAVGVAACVVLAASLVASTSLPGRALPAVTVNSTGDASDVSPGDSVCDTGSLNSQGAAECTLRAAIEEANASVVDTIDFAIPTTEPGYSASPLVWVITPNTPYDDLTSPVVLDATTQAGYTGDPIVELDGQNATGSTSGLNIRADDTTIRGFIVHSFDDEGLEIDGSTGFGDNNVLANNWVGIDASWNPKPNADNGILVSVDAVGNTIGGTGPNDGNVVVEGVTDGIVLRVSGTDGNTVMGNLVGVGPDGTTPMPNAGHGIHVYNAATGNVIGGTAPGAGNHVAHNALDGIAIATDAGPVNSILGNRVHDNGGLGIDLNDDGVTANDAGDPDSGPNDLLNFPVVTFAIESAGSVSADFDLDVPAGDYRVEFFTNPGGTDPSGNGEGESFAAATTVTHTGSGVESFSHSFPGAAGDVLTLTATSEAAGPAYGSSSELSAPYTVLSSTVTVNSTGDAGDASVGDLACNTGGVNTQGQAECTVRAAIQEANASRIDTIHFDIPTTETGYSASPLRYTVQPASQLDDITAPVTIDGTTQPDFPGTAIVELDGTLAGATADGLRLSGGSSTIRGLVVNRFTDDGIRIWGSGGNTLTGNHIGTDVGATTVTGYGNAAMGIRVSGVGGNQIGGTGPGEANVIGGNGADGITFRDPGATGNVAVGNHIGTDPTGTLDLGNVDDGVDIRGTAVNNRVGGTAAGEGNVIAFNGDSGIEVRDVGTVDNALLANHVFANGSLGIDLVGSLGIDTNDAGDTDTGANDLVNHPVLTSVVELAGALNVDFDLDVPAGDYRVEFFTNPSGADPSGRGEGEQFESAVTITHTGTGIESFTHAFPGSVGDVVTATATEAAAGPVHSSTSELSVAVTAGGPGPMVVNSTGDAPDLSAGDDVCDTGNLNSEGDPECTLRAAIEEANASAAVDTVEFAIPSSDPGHTPAPLAYTISPASALPGVSTTMTVDGTTQPDYAGTPVIELEGSGLGGGSTGLSLTGSSITIRGLVVNRFGTGVAVLGGDANTIVGNYLGPDVTGGVGLVGNSSQGLQVMGATNTVIGGTAAGDANVISGNRLRGVWINDWSDGPAPISDGTRIIGNRVGTDAAGTSALPYSPGVPQQIGIALWDGPDNVIGEVGAGNLISGNSWYGLYIWGANGTGNTVQANTIGMDASLTTPVPNGTESSARAGIYLSSAVDTLIGGTAAGEGNLIAGNAAIGVAVFGGDDNALLSNTITDNGEIGIDLDADGVTVNDPGDGDAGTNGLLNHPEIASAVDTGSTVSVTFSLDAPAGDYRIEFFTNPAGADPSGHGEGEVFASTTTVTHTGSGSEVFAHLLPGAAGDVITATATEQAAGPVHGSTSEFSAAVTAVAASSVVAADSSIRRSDLVPQGGLVPAATSPGVAGPALDFDGADDRLVGPPLDVTDGALTLSGWVELDAPGTDPRVVAKSSSGGATVYELYVDSATGEAVAQVRLGGTRFEARGGSVGVGAFHHLAAVWDGADLTVFVDGSPVGSTPTVGSLDRDLTMEVVVGNVGTADRALDGRIDEVRVAHTARSPEWLSTSHSNQSSPGTFLQFGAVQTGVPQPWTVAAGAGRSGTDAASAPETAAGADAWLTAIGLDEPGVELTTWWWFSTDSGIDLAAGTRTGVLPTDQYETGLMSAAGWDLATVQGSNRAQDAAPSGPVAPGAWVKVVIRTDQNDVTSVVIDGVEVIAPTAQSGGASTGSVGLRVGALGTGESWYVDDARVRRVVSPEPTTSLGPLDRD